MPIKKILFGLILMLVLMACGSSSQFVKPMQIADSSLESPKKYVVGVISSKVDTVPEHFLAAIQGFLKVELKKKGLYAENESGSSNVLDIEVTYYRMRSGFSRMMWGVFAGKDGVDSVVSISEQQTQKKIAELTVSSFNVAAVGESEDVARMHAEEIAEALEKAAQGGTES